MNRRTVGLNSAGNDWSVGELVECIVIAHCPFILVRDGDRQVVHFRPSLSIWIVPVTFSDGQQAESDGGTNALFVVHVMTAGPLADDGVDGGRCFSAGIEF